MYEIETGRQNFAFNYKKMIIPFVIPNKICRASKKQQICRNHQVRNRNNRRSHSVMTAQLSGLWLPNPTTIPEKFVTSGRRLHTTALAASATLSSQPPTIQASFNHLLSCKFWLTELLGRYFITTCSPIIWPLRELNMVHQDYNV